MVARILVVMVLMVPEVEIVEVGTRSFHPSGRNSSRMKAGQIHPSKGPLYAEPILVSSLGDWRKSKLANSFPMA